ncbi:MAG: hypothetical protein FWF31_03830 [Desulfobulbus sp.]|nr:hypothetical protein [Desulfobulbus sp.]
MDSRDVPQDQIPVFAGHSKAVYALDCSGEYTLVSTSGWEVEEIVTRQALDELAHMRQEALAAHRAGQLSPLAYQMYDKKMDVATLARESGFWQWRVRRHFRPEVFNKLSPKILAVYAEVLGIPLAELQQIDHAHD